MNVKHKYVSDNDYLTLRQAFGSENVGYRLFISSQINHESLSGKPVEISYMDENYRETHFCTPAVGKVPVKEDEIICDSRTLENLGINEEIGSIVSLEFKMRNRPYRVNFQVVGIIPSDEYIRQNMIVSKAFVDRYAAELGYHHQRLCGSANTAGIKIKVFTPDVFSFIRNSCYNVRG